MDHADHVALIRAGVEGGGPLWLELGAGRGAFTLALAELLGNGAQIDAVDRSAGDLRALASAVAARFPDTRLRTIVADFDRPLDLERGSYDGLLAANSLHFVRDPGAVLARVSPFLTAGARIVVVEYDSDGGNPWVPHPFSFRSWERIAAAAGLRETRLIGRVPSRFLEAIYAAASELPAAATNPD
jgi:ubiquinone/menaquinone biosynthesis C-methylase UbiE